MQILNLALKLIIMIIFEWSYSHYLYLYHQIVILVNACHFFFFGIAYYFVKLLRDNGYCKFVHVEFVGFDVVKISN